MAFSYDLGLAVWVEPVAVISVEPEHYSKLQKMGNELADKNKCCKKLFVAKE